MSMLWRDNERKNQTAESGQLSRDEQIRREEETEKKQREKVISKARTEAVEKRLADESARKTSLTDAQKRKLLIQQRRLEERQKRQERQKIIEQQRALQKKRREEAREEERKLRRELLELRRENKLYESKLDKTERAKLRRHRRIAKESAEMGGGIVNVHGTSVTTEIRPVASYSIRDILGIGKRKAIKQADTEEQIDTLVKEIEERREQARQVAAKLSKAKWDRRKDSVLGKKVYAFYSFCDKNQKALLIALSLLIILIVGAAGVINHLTVYEYLYNGRSMGYVKNKDDVLEITDMVQNALTEDSTMDVVIDARDDISFRRRFTVGSNYSVDSTEDVLRRLTYMGNLNVKAYGIYIDGKKAGAVESEETAADVLEAIKHKYYTNKKGSKIEEAVVVENVEIRQSNTDLEDVLTKEQMTEKLSTDIERETVYTVSAGETLEDIAEKYNVSEEELEETNSGVDPDNLKTGSTIVIKENAPLLTVKIKEVRTYEKKIKYTTEKKKTKKMYKGDTEVVQEGEDGLEELTDEIYTVNGEIINTDNVETVVKKEAVPKIVKVGTTKRPPTVGSGTYIWPAKKGTYTVTSEFKWRWGRQHQGIDLGCPTGTDVLAADGGTVTYAGYMGGYGYLVIIDHQNGVETYYGHNSSLLVSVGDKVYQGQHIAESGSTGRSTGPHIHFGIMVNGTFENPRNYLPSE